MIETILQFGTGNFLRAFAEYFIESMNRTGLYDGGVAIVSPTDSPNVDRLNAAGCKYDLLLRGIRDGAVVDERLPIRCVTRAVNPYRDFDGFISLAKGADLRFVISNTTESGIAYDGEPAPEDRVAASFPGKVCQLLRARFDSGLPGLVFLPCELIEDNGAALLDCVIRCAERSYPADGFADYIRNENKFCSTLVDRIVTGRPQGSAEELLDAAEPYHFWALEGDFEDELPLRKAGFNAVWTTDIRPYRTRKVRLLNGAHTSLVFPGLLCGVDTVGECLQDADLRPFLDRVIFGAVLPTLGDSEENRDFAASVLERFANPFIRHRLVSISLNSVSKFAARVLPTLEDLDREGTEDARGRASALRFSLACLIRYYKYREPEDLPENIERIRSESVDEILADSVLWGRAIEDPLRETAGYYENIEKYGARSALHELVRHQ